MVEALVNLNQQACEFWIIEYYSASQQASAKKLLDYKITVVTVIL